MRLLPPRLTALLFLATMLVSAVCRADFVPIALTSDSFNQDIVVEKTAPPPVIIVTTASMDSGTNNTGFSWYEKGYNLLLISSGLPGSGSIFSAPDHDYQFAPSYKSNNAVMIDAALADATLFLATPQKLARISLLLASGNGSGNLRTTVHYQDSTTQTEIVSCPDWMNAPGDVFEASGRVDVREFVFDGAYSTFPRLFGRDIVLSNVVSAVTSIEFSYVSGASHIAVFAASGSTNLVDPFNPLIVTGYNADLVVEASATRRQSLTTATSATMDNGTGNAGRSWYERGYYPPDSVSGLLAPGSLLTNGLAPDHVYLLPPSFTTNNVQLIDPLLDSGTLTPVSPTACVALSFLCASGHGPVTNQCIVQHANGLSESNSLVIPDWFDNSPPAFIAKADLNLNTRMVDSLDATHPRLFSVDINVTNTTSAITNVLLAFKSGASDSHSIIFALSGLAPQGTGVRPLLSISRLPAGNLRISTSQPGQLQSTAALNGTNTVWQYEGIISGTLDISPAPNVPAKYYRVLGQ